MKAARLGPWPAAGLAAASLAVLLSAPAQYLGRQQDDLLYIIGAQSLLQGRYRLSTVVGEPALYMTHPGWPLILAPVAWAAGPNLAWFQVFSALLLAAAPWALWLWLARRHDPGEAVLICLLFALNPMVLSQAGTVMSEAPALLLTLALLWRLERPGKGRAAGLLALAVTQVRTASLALLPALLARPVWKKRWALALWSVLPACAGLLLWSLWSDSVASAPLQKIEEFRVSYEGANLGRAFAVALENARFYLAAWGGAYLPARWAAGAAAALVGAALAALSLRGAAALLRRDPAEPAVWLLAGAALLHLVWPWQYERYLIPLLPFMLWTAAKGLGRAARPALIALLAAQAAFSARPWITGEASWKHPELERTYAWLRDNTGPADVVASAMYVRDGYYAGRPSLPLNDSPDARAFASLLKSRGARFVLWQGRLDLGLSVNSNAAVRRKLDRIAAQLEDPAVFRPVYQDVDEDARVFALR